MLYVLGVMLLFMAICVSVLTAAGSNAGFEKKQKDHTQLVVLADSVQKNILYSLQHDPSDENLLSRQLVYAIYKAYDPYYNNTTGISDMQLYMNDFLGDDIKVESIALSFLQPTVDIPQERAVPAIPQSSWTDEDGIEHYNPSASRIPKTATVSTSMTVTVRVSAKGRSMTSKTYYEYEGGSLSDDPEGKHYDDYDYDDSPHELDFVPGGYGEWKLVSHERPDQ